MIVVRMKGGLGNQLFQYALGRALSLKHNTKLKLDISNYDPLTPINFKRNYQLNAFKIHAAPISKTDYKLIPYKRLHFYGRTLLNVSFQNDHKLIYYKEKHFHFDKEALNLPNNSYLDGYWQSERYFKPISEIIRNDFSLKHPVSKTALNFSDQIKKLNSVSIHIRRGDYAKDPKTKKYHGLLPISYYQHSITLIKSSISSPTFFLFSDDINWVKKNLHIKDPHYFVSRDKHSSPTEDLYLMSLCKHNIIANSTLSWWGAWLNLNPKKVVIAPRNWFKTTANNTEDLLPSDWLTI